MSINEKIISYVQEVVRSKGMNELNLVRGEADALNLKSKQNLDELKQTLGYKITPTEFVIAWKLDKVLQDSGWDWENLEKARKALLTKMVLSEPQEELKKKFPVANVIYDKMWENDWWDKSALDEQNQAINQIAFMVHLAKDGIDAENIQNELRAGVFNVWDGLGKLSAIQQSLQAANVINTVKNITLLTNSTTATTPQRFTKSSVSIPVDRDQQRIEHTFENKEKIDFGARKNVSGQIKGKTKAQTSQNDKIRKAYSIVEKQAQEHLIEQLKKENKNMKNLYKDQKRFQETKIKSKTKKNRKWWIAGSLTGWLIGGSTILGFLFS